MNVLVGNHVIGTGNLISKRNVFVEESHDWQLYISKGLSNVVKEI